MHFCNIWRVRLAIYWALFSNRVAIFALHAAFRGADARLGHAIVKISARPMWDNFSADMADMGEMNVNKHNNDLCRIVQYPNIVPAFACNCKEM